MKTVVISGTLVEYGYSENVSKKDGNLYRNGSAVVRGDFDKIEVELKANVSDERIAKFQGLNGREDSMVSLLVDIGSGDNWRAEPRFYFLEDLTAKK